jgi:predicted N-acetyltransferase YhbS
LVVHPTYRGRGFSVSLDHVRLREAQRMNCSTAVVVTHLAHRARQLNVLGFVNVGVSQHRTVSYAPSNVLVKKFGGSQ